MDIDTRKKYRYLSIPESTDTFPITKKYIGNAGHTFN